MKIVHITISGPYNDGWGYQENKLAKFHNIFGYETLIIAANQINNLSNDELEYCQSHFDYRRSIDNYWYVRLPIMYKNTPIFRKLRIVKGLRRTLKEFQPDIIYCHGFSSLSLIYARRYLKENSNVKLLFDSHATYDNSARGFFSKHILHRVIWKSVYRLCKPYITSVLSIAESTTIFLQENYNVSSEHIEEIPLGADINPKLDKKTIREKIRNELNCNDDTFLCISGGKLTQSKKIIELMNAVVDNPNIKLIVFGSVSDDILMEFSQLHENNLNIVYLGWLDTDMMVEYMFASDLALFPGTKSAIWEYAIATGLPLICAKWKGMDYIDLGGNIKYFSTDSSEGIRDDVESLINDVDSYEEMKEIAIRLGEHTFSYESIARKVIDKL